MAATFGEKMKELIGQGAQASKELASKASAKAQDLGERGMLVLEIKQLKGQIQKLIDNLGDEVYQAFVNKGVESLGPDSPGIKEILTEIALIQETLGKKEFELQNKKDK